MATLQQQRNQRAIPFSQDKETWLHRFVALKFLHEDVAKDSQVLETFRSDGCAVSTQNLNLGFGCSTTKVPRFDGTWG